MVATRLFALLICCTTLSTAHAQVLLPLTGGKKVKFRDTSVLGGDSAKVTFIRDPALFTVIDPTCATSPGGASLRFSTDLQTNPLVTLPCQNWSLAGAGFRYSDPTGSNGGVQKVLYKLGKLVIQVKGNAYTPPLHGPVSFAEVRFKIGTHSLCGRFTTFSKNTAEQISGRGPTMACQNACGDGISEGNEVCDDGNLVNGDGCDNNCTATACGNGVQTVDEGCDDGNLVDGDGCDANCTVTGCGNGIESASEECDDGNLVSGDGCDNNCTPTACGNEVQTVGESCDDGNLVSGDGCRGDCTVELCGDTILDSTEQCDDGNLADGDCCSAACDFENGQPCSDLDLCSSGDVCVDGACVATPIAPWINEFDYDDFRVGGITDSDEFVEIAGPAGTDLSGYQIVSVEGKFSSCFTPVTSLITEGNAHFLSVVPVGTVLGDDTGTGIGFLVICFTASSSWHISQGHCDVVLPAPFVDSNLQNGHLVNSDGFTCPDGILLRDPLGQFVDAVSYEGQVPATGAYGPDFHITPYNIGADRGWKNGVSFEKMNSTLTRATAAAEWHLTGGCTFADAAEICVEESNSPGALNAGQSLNCAELYCGDGTITDSEECDDGDDNSNAPDAACRPDCTLRRCGDGVIDPTAAPAFPEECEEDAHCGGGQVCFACQCEAAGGQLGPLTFSVVPGPSELNPGDDGQSTVLRVTTLFAVATNGTQGNFNPGPLQLAAGAPGADGRAALMLTQPVVLGANLPAVAGTGKVCVRVRQDPNHLGEVDCDGGSAYGVELSVDSQGAGPNGTPTLTVGTGADSGPGGAILRVLVEAATTDDAVTPCEDAEYAPPLSTAVTTAAATSTILNAQQGGTTSVVQSGQPFNCSSWVENAGASIAGPNVNMDVELPLGLGTFDLAQVLRLNDD